MNRISADFLFAHLFVRRVGLWICLLLLTGPLAVHAQCPWDEREVLLSMDGTAASLEGWTLQTPTDGGKWSVDEGDIGGVRNPGEGAWVYVTEARTNDIGEAELISPLLNSTTNIQALTLSFDFVLETYQGAGLAWLAVDNGQEWIKIMELNDDYYGSIEINLGEFIGDPLQFRFVFEDEGEWSWGMGIDNFLLTGRRAECGDGICEDGENCPGDCPVVEEAPGWIEEGISLTGEEVTYTRFSRGAACDDCSEEVELGFSFSFYGAAYDRVYLNANGNLTFGESNAVFTPDAFCLEGSDMIAPFFADADLSHGGRLSYYKDPEAHYLIVTWSEIPYYGCDEGNCDQRNTFQAILTDGAVREIGEVIMPEGANVLLSYRKMDWTTGNGSGGNMGYGGSPATVGINHISGVICQDIGTFNRPGRAYYGNTMDLGCPPNEVHYLEGRSLILNADEGSIVEPTFDLTLIGEDHDAGHQLTWKTDRPSDWDYFSIEGGTDTSSYSELITIPAEAQPQLPLGMFSYQPGQASQFVWYRVTGITRTGDIQQSNWVEIGGLTSVGFELMNVGPNPMTGPVNTKIQVYESGELQWRLTSMSGQVLNAGNWQVEPGVHQGQLTFPELPAGTYVFTVMGMDTVQYRYVVKL